MKVEYLSDAQFGFASSYNGRMVRENAAANLFFGGMGADTLLYAETGARARTHSAGISSAVAVAVVTGLFCYMLNFLLSLVLIPRLFSDYVVLTAFVAGATAGMFLRRVRIDKQSLSGKKR
jgi:uncharacterized membrane protein YbhN (UPF0104 family)